MSEIVTTEELAERLRVPKHTVDYWRARGTGPPGIRVGKRVLYRWNDVETWLDRKADEDPMTSRSA